MKARRAPRRPGSEDTGERVAAAPPAPRSPSRSGVTPEALPPPSDPHALVSVWERFAFAPPVTVDELVPVHAAIAQALPGLSATVQVMPAARARRTHPRSFAALASPPDAPEYVVAEVWGPEPRRVRVLIWPIS